MSLKKSPAGRAVLGRGLDSLFGPPSETQNLPVSSPRVLGIEEMHPNPRQPRKIFDKEFLKELAHSIKKNGLIQPIIVKKAGQKYEIVAGERRWRAAAEAGLHEVPVRLLEAQADNPFLALIENLQREDLNPIELAEAYQKLMKTKELTQEELADQIGISRATLANQLRILKLAKPVQEEVLKGNLSFSVAKILLQEKDPAQQIKWARFFIKNKIGVREAQKRLARKSAGKKLSPLHKKENTQWQKLCLHKIQDLYRVKSHLRFKKKGGELCLRFFSEAELRQLMDQLLTKTPMNKEIFREKENY